LSNRLHYRWQENTQKTCSNQEKLNEIGDGLEKLPSKPLTQLAHQTNMSVSSKWNTTKLQLLQPQKTKVVHKFYDTLSWSKNKFRDIPSWGTCWRNGPHTHSNREAPVISIDSELSQQQVSHIQYSLLGRTAESIRLNTTFRGLAPSPSSGKTDTLYSNELTRLCTREDYIESCRRESFKTYRFPILFHKVPLHDDKVGVWCATNVTMITEPISFQVHKFTLTCYILIISTPVQLQESL
jgi:hypothetical protein